MLVLPLVLAAVPVYSQAAPQEQQQRVFLIPLPQVLLVLPAALVV
jgi:hypothetical protein